jgi:hypothetical protein
MGEKGRDRRKDCLQFKEDWCNSTTQSEKKFRQKDCLRNKSKMLHNMRS